MHLFNLPGGNDPESLNRQGGNPEENFGFRRRSDENRKNPGNRNNFESSFGQHFGVQKNFPELEAAEFEMEPKSVTEKVKENFENFDNYDESSYTSQRRIDDDDDEAHYRDDDEIEAKQNFENNFEANFEKNMFEEIYEEEPEIKHDVEEEQNLNEPEQEQESISKPIRIKQQQQQQEQQQPEQQLTEQQQPLELEQQQQQQQQQPEELAEAPSQSGEEELPEIEKVFYSNLKLSRL